MTTWYAKTKHHKFNRLLQLAAERYISRAFRKTINRFSRENPAAFKPCHPELEAAHRSLWRPLGWCVSCKWLRYFVNTSNIIDHEYMPDDVYHAVIERIMNDLNYSWIFADKCFYRAHIALDVFPQMVLCKVGGDFLDADRHRLSRADARRLFNGCGHDLVVKPSVDSCGGIAVAVLRHEDSRYRLKDGTPMSFDDMELSWVNNFIVQEYIKQHNFFSALNPSSVNTVRVLTYRSPVDEQIVPLRSLIRMGIGDVDVDNEGQGGIHAGINTDGCMNSYAISKYGHKLTAHPSSHIVFDGLRVPCLNEMLELAVSVAGLIPTQRILSFDMVLDRQESVKILEINTYGQSVNFLQVFGGPLFGTRTQEVVEWCAANKHRNEFKHIRLIG